MRALDCVHDAHEDIHFTAESDDDLLGQVREHRDQYHPEMSDDDVRNIVAASAYDE
ncbi:MAG: hypothetical protein M3214_05235 [Actinomycetota bacterium]|nr:hypothetical protein [Actinomycetota bacterium]